MLKIGVIARNLALARKALDVLSEIDQDATKEKMSLSELIMSDDTQYMIIADENSCRGVLFDQLIIFSDGLEDKDKDEIIDEFAKTITYVGENVHMHSCVPKAYRVMIYEL